ncbi:hypothetical protein BDFB_004732 [Asbolus verrucosus]|uniref:Uncharacterized protein n=1 Tax=Asbolus verrucosus TaxID=1661398 RepID=A0A482VPI5_ASBVE|nr:hypothetical protein BDFB_004732 [Asbolus verrucosus]
MARALGPLAAHRPLQPLPPPGYNRLHHTFNPVVEDPPEPSRNPLLKPHPKQPRAATK